MSDPVANAGASADDAQPTAEEINELIDALEQAQPVDPPDPFSGKRQKE